LTNAVNLANAAPSLNGSSGNLTVTGTMVAGSSYAWRNAIINGDMRIWQRGTSAAGSYPTYLADRWMNYRAVAGSTFSRQTFNDATNVPGIQTCQRIQRDSGNTSTTAIYISQSVETLNSIPFVGQSVTLSFYARAGANFSAASGNMTFEIVSGTGTDQNVIAGFTGQTNVAAGTRTLTTTWQRFTATGTVSSSATQLAVNLYYIPVGTAGAADFMEITGVQLEVGTVATPFERRDYGRELIMCQRYFQKSYPVGNAPGNTDGAGLVGGTAMNNGANNIGNNGMPVAFRVNMRAATTITIYAPYSGTAGSMAVAKGGTPRADYVASVANASETGFVISSSASGSGGTAGTATELLFQYTASAEL
jgi:hypothetical protein